MARINVTFPGEPSLPCRLRKTHEYGSITPPTVNKDVILSDIEQSEGEIEGNAIAFASLRKLSSKDVARCNPAFLFKLIQIGVRSGIAQDTAHGDDLALVMEGVSQHVMKDECGCPHRAVSIGEMQLCGSNQALLAEA
jgi:hypothetical protein